MMSRSFDPWVGDKYQKGTGLLIISESVYRWPSKGKIGQFDSPQIDHPTGNTVGYWALQNFEERGKEGRYAATLTRALCNKESPSLQERTAAWNQIAYSIYVQRTMETLQDRPTNKDLELASQPFLDLLEELRPARVLVTGYAVWKGMPRTHVIRDMYLQAYRLKDGHLCWCQAVRHPRVTSWRNLAKQLKHFEAQAL
jgi:hypothetical protein